MTIISNKNVNKLPKITSLLRAVCKQNILYLYFLKKNTLCSASKLFIYNQCRARWVVWYQLLWLVAVFKCSLLCLRPHRVEALSDAFVWRLSVCLTSVTYIGPKSKTKIGRGSHVTRDSDTTFKVKGQLVADVINSQHGGTGATWQINTKILLCWNSTATWRIITKILSTCRVWGMLWWPCSQLVLWQIYVALR